MCIHPCKGDSGGELLNMGGNVCDYDWVSARCCRGDYREDKRKAKESEVGEFMRDVWIRRCAGVGSLRRHLAFGFLFLVCFVQIADGGGVLISQKMVFLESRCKECADDLPCQQISLELCAPMFHRQRAAYARLVTNFTPKYIYIYMCTCAESMPESASRPFQEHHQLPPSSLWTCISPLHAVSHNDTFQ